MLGIASCIPYVVTAAVITVGLVVMASYTGVQKVISVSSLNSVELPAMLIWQTDNIKQFENLC